MTSISWNHPTAHPNCWIFVLNSEKRSLCWLQLIGFCTKFKYSKSQSNSNLNLELSNALSWIQNHNSIIAIPTVCKLLSCFWEGKSRNRNSYSSTWFLLLYYFRLFSLNGNGKFMQICCEVLLVFWNWSGKYKSWFTALSSITFGVEIKKKSWENMYLNFRIDIISVVYFFFRYISLMLW